MKISHVIFITILATIALARTPSPDGRGVAHRDWPHFGHNGDIRALCRVGDSLWVGTGGGLFIYDLASSEIAEHITVGDQLPSNSVRAISARNDNVYVGTDDGLSLFAHDSVSVFTNGRPGPFVGAPFDLIRRVDFGLDGAVYLSTFGRGLGVLDGDTAWVITKEDSLLDDKLFGMVQEDDTTFYFATSMGLCAFRDSLWVSFQAGAGLPRAQIRGIMPSPDGAYYLLVGGRGVYWFDGQRARRVSAGSLFEEDAVAGFAVDASGDLWACGGHGGVAVYRNRHWTRLEQKDMTLQPEQKRWRCAYADTLGGVYFGSADGWVLYFQDDVTARFRLPVELPSGAVESITSDSTGALYVVNGAYLVRIRPGLETFTLEHPRPVVVSVAVAPTGELWTATRWGLYRRQGEQYVEFAASLSERSPLFSAIGFDQAGALWVGTQAGNVHRYDGELWMRMADADELGVGVVRSFHVDGRGRLWATGSSGNIAMFRNGRWTVFGHAAFGDRPVRTAAMAPSGVPVLATDRGIWGFDEGGVWKSVEFDNAINNNELPNGDMFWNPASPPILALAFDPSGRLYVGTEGGLAVIDDSGTRWFTPKDGLGGKSVTSVFVQGEDALWVGFRSDGLTRIPLHDIR